MQDPTAASVQPAKRHRPGAGRSHLPIVLIVAMLALSFIGLLAWAVTHSRSVSRHEAVEMRTPPADDSLSRGWAIGAGFAVALTVAWNAGLAAAVVWLVSRIL